MIGIIGAGISGLSAAYHLLKQGKNCLVLEASAEAGGCLQSERQGAYLFEKGANSLLADKETLDFIQELGLEKELIKAKSVSKKRFILKNGAYHSLPSSPPSLLFGSFFSWATKITIFKEMRKPSQQIPHETLGAFIERRFGREIVNYALNPFVSGIYAGDPYRLLVKKTFPQLVDYEQTYGSVIKGMMKNKTAERKLSISFKDGMKRFPQKIAEKVAVDYKTKALKISRKEGKWLVETEQKTYIFDQLILSLPAYHAAHLLQDHAPEFAKILSQVNYPPMAVVHSIFKKSQLSTSLNGFGGLHPKCENPFSAGSLWSSSVFEARCQKDEVLITSFVGGVQYTDSARLPAHQILQELNVELKKLYGIEGGPVLQKVTHWDKAIPQYDTAINAVYEGAKTFRGENLFFCANWIDGISAVDCWKKGKKLALEL
jgi:protoporphyrinogen/coproporphyrinogen III oxidase